jgi:hypothetical protein
MKNLLVVPKLIYLQEANHIDVSYVFLETVIRFHNFDKLVKYINNNL